MLPCLFFYTSCFSLPSLLEINCFFGLLLLNDSTFLEFLGIFLTLMEMTSLMTGFILNGLSESLLSSRLFRIKAWVLQVPFLSMIFLYFFDYSNLNHSKVFYLFLYYNNFSVSLCRYVAVLKFCFALSALSTKICMRLLRHLRLFALFLHSSVSGTTIVYFCSYLVVSSFLISRVQL